MGGDEEGGGGRRGQLGSRFLAQFLGGGRQLESILSFLTFLKGLAQNGLE
jgi:hypothetical protein